MVLCTHVEANLRLCTAVIQCLEQFWLQVFCLVKTSLLPRPPPRFYLATVKKKSGPRPGNEARLKQLFHVRSEDTGSLITYVTPEMRLKFDPRFCHKMEYRLSKVLP